MRATFFISIVLANAMLSTARAGSVVPPDPIVAGQAIVNASTPAALAQTIAALSVQFPAVSVALQIPNRPIYLLSYELAPKQTTHQFDLALGALVTQGTLTWAELNYEGQTAEGKTDSLWLSGLGINANAYDSQYAVPLLGLKSAHRRSRGAGVVVSVIDTGIDATHPVFENSISPLGASFIANSPSFSDIGDGLDNDGDGFFDEQVGHGTFIAGLIHLVAPDAMILPVRVLDSDGRAGNFQVAQALAWSIDRGAHVVNMSLGETYHSNALEDLAQEALQRGIIIVAAAGNFDVEDPREYPANDSNACGVTALDSTDHKASFTNFEIDMDLAAPGVSRIIKGVPDLAQCVVGPVPSGGFAVWQGTSMATAFASGTVALVRSQNPQWPDAQTPNASIFNRVMDLIDVNGVSIDELNPQFAGMLGRARISPSGVTAALPIAPRVGDVNFDGVVNAADLTIQLSQWGVCEPSLRSDLNADGIVNAADIVTLLSNW